MWQNDTIVWNNTSYPRLSQMLICFCREECILECWHLHNLFQVKMAVTAYVPTMRRKWTETGTLLLLSTRPTHAHLRNSACPEQSPRLRHLVAGVIITDIVHTTSSPTISTSRLLRRRRKRSMKVCLAYLLYKIRHCKLPSPGTYTEFQVLDLSVINAIAFSPQWMWTKLSL